MALFVDSYPPFGDQPYPATIEVGEPLQPRDTATIAVRLILALPHLVMLCVLLLGWLVTTVIAWFAILFTRSYPPSLLTFGIGVMRWALRVEAYLLLLVDEYPPFALDCQVAVTAALWTGMRAWMLGAALYLPEEWLTPEARQRARIPATVRFQEKWRLALTLLRQIERPASRSPRCSGMRNSATTPPCAARCID